MKNKYIVFLILCAIIGGLMNGIGYGLGDWQWWIGCGCTWFSYICGACGDKE